MSDKIIVIEGKDAVNAFRMKVLLRGMELEGKGMRLSRGASCLSIVKREFGLKGNRDSIIAQFKTLLAG